MFFRKRIEKKERKARLDAVETWAFLIFDMYLKSKEKHIQSLEVFDIKNSNLNEFCECIFLLGLYDALVLNFDKEKKYLKPKDTEDILVQQFNVAEDESYKPYYGISHNLELEGEYQLGSYKIEDEDIKPLESLFYAVHECFKRLVANKEEVVLPIISGVKKENNFDLYDFKDFSDLKLKWETESK